MYHGRLSGELWPAYWQGGNRSQRKQQPSAEERFNALYSEHSPEYFIVISRFTQRNQQGDFWNDEEYQELRGLLTEKFRLVAEDEDYVVFDLRRED